MFDESKRTNSLLLCLEEGEEGEKGDRGRADRGEATIYDHNESGSHIEIQCFA